MYVQCTVDVHVQVEGCTICTVCTHATNRACLPARYNQPVVACCAECCRLCVYASLQHVTSLRIYRFFTLYTIDTVYFFKRDARACSLYSTYIQWEIYLYSFVDLANERINVKKRSRKQKTKAIVNTHTAAAALVANAQQVITHASFISYSLCVSIFFFSFFSNQHRLCMYLIFFC